MRFYTLIKVKFILIFILSISYIPTYTQVKLTNPDTLNLPISIHYSGHIINAVKWSDSLGVNYVITTETGEINRKENETGSCSDASLYAYHFIVNNDSAKLIWRIYDFNNACPFDLDLHFIDKTFAVTDLDKNGICEVWIMYKNSCYSDVSPAQTKIIMYEGRKKYALRGESRVRISTTEFLGGNFTLDDNFKTGNIFFRQFAEKLWNQYKSVN